MNKCRAIPFLAVTLGMQSLGRISMNHRRVAYLIPSPETAGFSTVRAHTATAGPPSEKNVDSTLREFFLAE
jgi:hypothetical protein